MSLANFAIDRVCTIDFTSLVSNPKPEHTTGKSGGAASTAERLGWYYSRAEQDAGELVRPGLSCNFDLLANPRQMLQKSFLKHKQKKSLAKLIGEQRPTVDKRFLSAIYQQDEKCLFFSGC